ncbi:helix-turn-helix domain-containing protein [Blastochloris tepida]|uniref:Helix-turn-helix domain-containing protein n=1 Tax=Blastochloris tepida TaxID=2233851 RepID=A0A348G1D0_9HYPH|nr:helix-turn-helix domain-containing protein [Blastochloris tepida]BBF93363.1 hypothetical protein BLTE_20480 [Blastochloris tepida]
MNAPLGQRFRIQAWAREQRCGSPAAKIVLMVLAEHADEDGWAWPSVARIAAISEQSEDTVARKLGDLERLGLIAKVPTYAADGRRTANRYRVNLARTTTDDDVAELRGDRRPAACEADGAPSEEQDVVVAPANCGGQNDEGGTRKLRGSPPHSCAGVILELPNELTPLPPADHPSAGEPDPGLGLGVERFWAGYPGSAWSDRQRRAAEKAWTSLSADDRTRVLAVLPDVARRARVSGKPPRPPAEWLASRQWAAPEAADGAGRVWVAEDSPEGRAWDVLSQLVFGLGSTAWSDQHRCRGAWRPCVMPPAFGLGVGAVPRAEWVLVAEGTPEFAAWRGRLTEMAAALGSAVRIKPPAKHFGRDPASGQIIQAVGWDVPMRTPPPRPASGDGAERASSG